MSGPNCHNCIYSVCDPEAWLRLMSLGEPILPTCANHPRWPAQLHEVPGVPCKNYRRKPKVPQGDVRLIPLVDGLYAYVDAADYEQLSRWSWHMASGGYAARNAKGRTIFMHREIMQPPKGKVVDHHDGNKANNCRFNLRICTSRQNRCNVPRQGRGRSGFKGAYYDSRGRVFARITFESKVYYLGYFPDEVTAARAYDHAAIEAFGEYARPNFPNEWPPQRRRRVHAQAARRGGPSFTRRPIRRRRKSSSTRRRDKSSSARTPANRRAKSSSTGTPRRARHRTKGLPQRPQRSQRTQRSRIKRKGSQTGRQR